MNVLLILAAMFGQVETRGGWNIVTCSNSYNLGANSVVGGGLCSIPDGAPSDEELVITVESGSFLTTASITAIENPLANLGRTPGGRQVQIKVTNPNPIAASGAWKITIKWLDTISQKGYEVR